MTYRVVLTARAEHDRDALYGWYAENYSPAFAARWYAGLTKALRGLSENSLACGVALENDKFPFEVRELLFGGRRHKHRVLFTIQEDLVSVLHIRHSAQREMSEDDL